MKKTKILFILVLVILLLGLGYQVYGKYVLSKKVSISFNTSDYYFEISTDKKEIKSLPATINVTVKNYSEENFTDNDLEYTVSTSKSNLGIEISEQEGTLLGGSKQEKTFTITLKEQGIDWISEQIEIEFDIKKPYLDTKSVKIVANRYNVDDCIMFLDAINNTENGHSTSTESWYNWYGNTNATLNDFDIDELGAWQDKGLKTSGTETVVIPASFSTGSDITAEVICSVYDFSLPEILAGNQGWAGFNYHTKTPGYVYVGTVGSEVDEDSRFLLDPLIELNKTFMMTYTYDSNSKVASVYINGNLIESKTISATSAEISYFSIRPSYNIYNRIALYNRALTADEVYQNYEIDKVRYDISSSTEVAITTIKNDEKTAKINATAEDNGAGVKKYDFYINDELKHTVTTSDLTASYSFDYASTFGTTYDTYVVVTDNNNATNKSNTSTIIDYTVSDKQDMELFRNSVNNGNTYENETIIQTADIDLQGSESNQWTPIGNYGENTNLYFAGTYEGNNYTISNLYINDSSKDYQGLFGYSNSANINNLELENVNITGKSYVGNIIGNGVNSTLYNVHINSGTLNGESLIGGILGNSNATQITQCTNKSNINTTQVSKTEIYHGGYGGIVGRATDGKIQYCVNYGNITGDVYVGGITGINWTETLNCYNTGTMKGLLNDLYIGGISGVQNGANNVGQKIVNCYNIGSVISESSVKGGIVGVSDSTVTNCYYLEGTATGGINGADVTGQAEVRTSAEMKTDTFLALLNNGESNWKIVAGVNSGYPILYWQTDEAVTEVAITTIKNDEKTAKINATAEDNGAGVKKYDFYINDELKHTVTTSDLTASYSFDYASTFGTTYDTYVVVTDNNNATNKSNTSTIIDYTVSDKQDMELFRNSVNNGNTYENETIIQTADIDLQGSESNQWTPIGNYGIDNNLYFAGTFNGNNKKVENIYISTTKEDWCTSLFGCCKGEIINLGVKNININAPNAKFVGGVVGVLYDGEIKGCYSTGVIKASGYVGGIAGENYATISNCYNTAKIIADSRSGGVVGKNTSGEIIKCFNNGEVSVSDYGGGITGENIATISNCYNTANIIASGSRVGGIAGSGYPEHKIENSYNIGNISNVAYHGGLVGAGPNYGFGVDGIVNSYYLEGTASAPVTGENQLDVIGQAEVRTSATMKTIGFVNLLGNSNWKLVQGVNNGYPILSWQEGEAYTPIDNAWFLKGNSFGISGEGQINADGSLTLKSNSKQYGPYITLEAGTYQVRYSGTNLNNGDFWAAAMLNTGPEGEKEFDINKTTVSPNSIIYTFDVTDHTTHIEFLCINTSTDSSDIIINFIELIKLD